MHHDGVIFLSIQFLIFQILLTFPPPHNPHTTQQKSIIEQESYTTLIDLQQYAYNRKIAALHHINIIIIITR